jgi:hypothetical protein
MKGMPGQVKVQEARYPPQTREAQARFRDRQQAGNNTVIQGLEIPVKPRMKEAKAWHLSKPSGSSRRQGIQGPNPMLLPNGPEPLRVTPPRFTDRQNQARNTLTQGFRIPESAGIHLLPATDKTPQHPLREPGRAHLLQTIAGVIPLLHGQPVPVSVLLPGHLIPIQHQAVPGVAPILHHHPLQVAAIPLLPGQVVVVAPHLPGAVAAGVEAADAGKFSSGPNLGNPVSLVYLSGASLEEK